MPRDGDEERGQMPRPRDQNIGIHVDDRFFDKPNIVHLVAVKNQDILNDDESHMMISTCRILFTRLALGVERSKIIFAGISAVPSP